MPIRKTKTYASYVLCILSALSYSLCLRGQTTPSFGLGFYNNETVQDRRTTLDLTPGKAFTFHGNTDIRFDLAFLPGHSNSFGYILRLVSNNTRNIDLLFDKVRMSEGHFRMVVGDKPPFATFTLDSNHLFHSWTPIRLTIDFSRDRILLAVNNKETFIQNGMPLSPSDSFRISFGACPVQQFKTTDVAPMKIRDVRISSDRKDLYNWPLDEEKGTQAPETLQEASGVV